MEVVRVFLKTVFGLVFSIPLLILGAALYAVLLPLKFFMWVFKDSEDRVQVVAALTGEAIWLGGLVYLAVTLL